MRSQSQLRNDKYIMMQYTNWINSTPLEQEQIELYSSMENGENIGFVIQVLGVRVSPLASKCYVSEAGIVFRRPKLDEHRA